jgi:hypothetical protein
MFKIVGHGLFTQHMAAVGEGQHGHRVVCFGNCAIEHHLGIYPLQNCSKVGIDDCLIPSELCSAVARRGLVYIHEPAHLDLWEVFYNLKPGPANSPTAS